MKTAIAIGMLLAVMVMTVHAYADPVRVVQYGVASWYDEDSHVATGARYNPEGKTCAHRTAPFGTRFRITRLDDGRSTECDVNDLGPNADTGRLIDVSRYGARKLGMLVSGLARVQVERLN